MQGRRQSLTRLEVLIFGPVRPQANEQRHYHG